jgi:hypothetical protein
MDENSKRLYNMEGNYRHNSIHPSSILNANFHFTTYAYSNSMLPCYISTSIRGTENGTERKTELN